LKVKIYTYKGCSTCKKATKFLKDQGINFEELPIRGQPPSPEELRKMLKQKQGDLCKLFNTSGLDYRELELGKKLAEMTEAEAIELLAGNGNLVKRPFVFIGSKGTVGFKQDEWELLLAS
jgi:arsenate reductase